MIIQIHVPIYRCSVLCFCDSSLKEFDEFYYKNVKGFTNKEYDEICDYIKNDKGAYAWTQHLQTTDIMIWFTRPRVDMDVVHEFYHATHMILWNATFTTKTTKALATKLLPIYLVI